jgi:hypothetical protein
MKQPSLYTYWRVGYHNQLHENRLTLSYKESKNIIYWKSVILKFVKIGS